jgi:hypothetical protein
MAFWQHDERIEEGTALRDLEKKVHYLMHVLANAGIAPDWRGEQFSSPDDLPNKDVYYDASEVQAGQKPQG